MFRIVKHFGKPDLLQVYKNDLIVKILAAICYNWISAPPLDVPLCVTFQNSVYLLRYQVQSWSGSGSLHPSITFAVNAFDSIIIVGILFMSAFVSIYALEILTLGILFARAVR